MPLSNDVIRGHLIGIDPTDRYGREFVIDVYEIEDDQLSRRLLSCFRGAKIDL